MKRIEQLERKSKKLPWILKTDRAGHPIKWISWQDTVVMAFTDKILHTYGEPIILNGGVSGQTGERSTFELYPIISCDDPTASKKRMRPPGLTNRELFRRDGNLCMYCGNEFPVSKLTRDHIIPISKGGLDSFTNCTTSCSRCNHHKRDRTPEEAGMMLLAVPFVPSRAMHLILQNRKIILCQLEFLKAQLKDKELQRLQLN